MPHPGGRRAHRDRPDHRPVVRRPRGLDLSRLWGAGALRTARVLAGPRWPAGPGVLPPATPPRCAAPGPGRLPSRSRPSNKRGQDAGAGTFDHRAAGRGADRDVAGDPGPVRHHAPSRTPAAHHCRCDPRIRVLADGTALGKEPGRSRCVDVCRPLTSRCGSRGRRAPESSLWSSRGSPSAAVRSVTWSSVTGLSPAAMHGSNSSRVNGAYGTWAAHRAPTSRAGRSTWETRVA